MEEVIVEILQAVGVYEHARERVNSDQELVDLFQNDFEKLIRKVGG